MLASSRLEYEPKSFAIWGIIFFHVPKHSRRRLISGDYFKKFANLPQIHADEHGLEYQFTYSTGDS
jgi:hypothetical protein